MTGVLLHGGVGGSPCACRSGAYHSAYERASTVSDGKELDARSPATLWLTAPLGAHSIESIWRYAVMSLAWLVLVAAGVLLVAISVPLIRRKIRPNAFYGLRTSSTFADPNVWYAANAVAGRDLAALGATIALLASILAFLDGSATGVLVCGALLGLGAIIVAVRGAALANRMLARRHSRR